MMSPTGILADAAPTGGAALLLAAVAATAALAAAVAWKAGAIAKTTFVQTIRQPIYIVLVLLTFGMLIFTLPLAGWTVSTDYHQTDQQMLEDLGLGTLRVAGLLVAAFSASAVLRRELDDKTALVVLAKPVSRSAFVVGKFAGVLGAVAVAYYLSALVFLMTVRHHVMPAAWDKADWPVIVLGGSAFVLAVAFSLLGNLAFGWPFASTGVWAAMGFMTAAAAAIGFVGKGWHVVPFASGVSGQLLLELAMMLLALMILSALAIAVSTRLGATMTLLVCAGVFLLGSAHPLIFARWGREVLVVRLLGWAVPNFTQFYPQDDLTVRSLSLAVVGWSWLYGLLYTAGVLGVGVALFQTRQLEVSAASAAMPALVGVAAWSLRAAAVAAGLVALALPSLGGFLAPGKVALAAGLLAAAAAGWFLAGGFAHGKRWSYWGAAALAVGALAAAGAWLLGAAQGAPAGAVGRPVLAFAAAALAGGLLLVLALPKTRRHFDFGLVRKRKIT